MSCKTEDTWRGRSVLSDATDGSVCRAESQGRHDPGGGNTDKVHNNSLSIAPTCVATHDDSSETRSKNDTPDTDNAEALPSTNEESVGHRGKPRTRLTLAQKIEVLELLRNKVQLQEIARRYSCSERTIYSISHKREILEKEAKLARYKDAAKSLRPAAVPKLDEGVAELVVEARKYKMNVTYETITSFALAVRNRLLSSDDVSPDDRSKLETFGASRTWIKNFVRRQGLTTAILQGDGEGVDPESIRQRIKDILSLCKEYRLDHVFNADALNGLIYSVQSATGGNGGKGTKLSNVLASLDIAPGRPAHETAIEIASALATSEERDCVAEGLEVILEKIYETYVVEDDSSDMKEKGDSIAEERRLEPSLHPELSSQFDRLESFAESESNPDAVLHLQMARECLCGPPAPKRARHADVG